MGRREEIIEVARDLFLQKGLEGLTMREVAETIGFSTPALYKHFKNKDDILKAVVDLGRERFTLYLTRGLKGQTPIERLRLCGEGYLDFAMDYPHDYQIIFLSHRKLRPGIHAPDRDGSPPPALQFFIDRVRECLPKEDADDQVVLMKWVMFLWAQVHGMASFYVSGAMSGLMAREQFRAMTLVQLEQILGLLCDQISF